MAGGADGAGERRETIRERGRPGGGGAGGWGAGDDGGVRARPRWEAMEVRRRAVMPRGFPQIRFLLAFVFASS